MAAGRGRVPTQQGLAHQAGMGTRQHDQARVQLLQPGPGNLGLGLGFAQRLCPGTGQDFGQVQIPLVVLHQHQQAAFALIALGLHHQLGPQHGFDPFAAGAFIELQAAKEIIQIGNGQGGLPIGLGSF